MEAISLFSALAINPAVILSVGALLCVFVPSALRRVFALVFIAVSAFQLYRLGLGEWGHLEIFGEPVTILRLDPLSRLFAVVFHIAAAINIIYAWHERDRIQTAATLAYPAAALGGVLAGDLVTLGVWWEIAAITSVFLVWAPGTRMTYLAGMRYLTIQVLSGVLLLAGVVLGGLVVGSVEWLGHWLYPLPTGLDIEDPKELALAMAELPIGAFLGWALATLMMALAACA